MPNHTVVVFFIALFQMTQKAQIRQNFTTSTFNPFKKGRAAWGQMDRKVKMRTEPVARLGLKEDRENRGNLFKQ